MVVSRTGLINPPLIAGGVAAVVASALTTMFKSGTSKAAWATIELFAGIGFGAMFNQRESRSQERANNRPSSTS